MTRIANERTILEIEAAIEQARPGLDAQSWDVNGAECRHEQHRFAGQGYAFSIEILDVHHRRKGQRPWHMLVVTERWQGPGRVRADLRSTKWLKLLEGNTTDVVAWMRTCRPLWRAPSAGSAGR